MKLWEVWKEAKGVDKKKDEAIAPKVVLELIKIRDE